MLKNRFTLIAAVLLILFVSLAVSMPFSNAPKLRNLSWPPRPVIVPVTGANELSDYYQRHSQPNISAGIALDMADYFMRHSELRISTESIELSDYYQRHAKWRDASAESDSSVLQSSPVDECFDVALSEVAACREASESSAP